MQTLTQQISMSQRWVNVTCQWKGRWSSRYERTLRVVFLDFELTLREPCRCPRLVFFAVYGPSPQIIMKTFSLSSENERRFISTPLCPTAQAFPGGCNSTTNPVAPLSSNAVLLPRSPKPAVRRIAG